MAGPGFYGDWTQYLCLLFVSTLPTKPFPKLVKSLVNSEITPRAKIPGKSGCLLLLVQLLPPQRFVQILIQATMNEMYLKEEKL